MQIPPKHLAIADEIVSKCLKYSERRSVPAPTLIRGNTYEGSHLVIREIHRKLLHQPSEKIKTFFYPLALTESNITNELQKIFANLNLTKKKPTIFFLEGIDRLFNLSVKHVKRELSTGKGANSIQVVEETHRLRKFLLENSNRVTIIATSGPHPTFMQHPDLPFYKFFNEISLTPLHPEETSRFIMGLLKVAKNGEPTNGWINELAEAAFEWPYALTGGRTVLMHMFLNSIFSLYRLLPVSPRQASATIVVENYLMQIHPMLSMEIDSYSREERRFLERAANFGVFFFLKELNFQEGNASLIAQKLIRKGVLESVPSLNGKYIFTHRVLRTFLRYFSTRDILFSLSESKTGRSLDSMYSSHLDE
jgi:hypothetical protein